ncbi:MAG TPA: hypothetical protein VK856_01285, partial [Anaerolineaceae bacterium]|nr:hypothetical protein [Anaerolineaceae bacterium]
MLVDPLHWEQEDDAVFPPKSFANKAEQIQELVNALVENYRDTNQITELKRKKIPASERNVPGLDLSLHKSWLAEAHSYFRKSIHQKVALTYTSEWVLDNYYIIRQALLQIKEDLPSNFYKQLPRLTSGPLKGYPRIYAITRSMLTFQHFLIDPIELQKILIQYQKHVSLTMGELWAFPIFLRYGLIEVLSHSLVSVIRPENAPHLPPIVPQLPGVRAPSLNWGNEGGETNNNQNSIANIIHGLRTISAQNWSEFFESVSCLEKTLRKDPAGIYSQMDFKTRDLYRAEIETLSFSSRKDENELAETIIKLAGSSTHIGEFLLGEGRAALEQEIGYHPTGKTAFKRWVFQHPSLVYFSSILLLTIGIIVLIVAIIQNFHFSENLRWSTTQSPGSAFLYWTAVVLMAAAVLVPVLTITTSLINWLITLLIPPRTLPKLDFKSEIPKKFQTLVVIPGLIVDRQDIDSLTQQLEMHYLRNPEPGLLFALLTDFRDADSETLPEDEDLVEYALQAIAVLNKKYGSLPPCPEPVNTFIQSPEEEFQPGNDQLFFVFHRKRLWNSSEGKWIGWERKRGKLNELNQLLRGEKDLTYTTLTSEMYIKGCAIQNVRFVITLDADTILPHGAACRLVGTLAHPLNQAVFDETTGKVVSGYTVLQPRMEIHPRSARFSWFTRFFAGDAGLDLYTLSVSDAYQDLFGEGSYVGKGIYDVDAFEYSVNNKIPENTVLSHDLLEGLMGRAALVTDITMIEDYPQNYFIQISRMRRWIRGDWQLLPWLFRRNRNRLSFSWIDRWKLFDNLRRSLLAPALLLIFLVGFIFFPTYSLLWTAIVLISLAIPLLTGLSRSALQIVGGENPRLALQPLGWNFLRWLLAIAFLPYEAYICIDAILTTLYRLAISHRDLLQWTTAAQTARIFGLDSRKQAAWQKMIPSSALAIAFIVGTQLFSAHNLSRIAPILIITSPVLILWLLSPAILWWVNRPIIKNIVHLNQEQANRLRQITRLTWGFFERFVGPEDHWLPPDHFQETPNGTVAHRTSPTNIGLLLTSTLAAYDMGYLDQLGLATRLDTTMDSLDRLERFRGHFLNWYDTLTLQPLTPRYVSTVDSGNLAASFIVTSQGCKSMSNEQVFRWNMWQGYQDTLSNLTETLTGMKITKFDQQVEEINLRITRLQTNILAVRFQPEQWYPLFLTVSGPFWKDLSNRLMKLLEVGRSAFDLKTLEKLQEVAAQVNRHHLAVQRTITELIPWIPLLESLPTRLQDPQYAEMMNDLRANLSYNPLLGEVPTQTEAALSKIISIQKILS